MSYYSNGPRIFTPSTFKQTTQFLPVESFGSPRLGEEPPANINTCHKSRFTNLQQTHPSTRARSCCSPWHIFFLATLAVLPASSLGERTMFDFRFCLLSRLAGTYHLLRKAEAEKAAATLAAAEQRKTIQ